MYKESSHADGSGLVKPIPPSREAIEKVKQELMQVDKILATNGANWELLSHGDKEYTIRQREISGSLSNQLKSLEAQYAKDFERYQTELKVYLEALKITSGADPELAKAASEIQAMTIQASQKKYMIVGIIIAMLLIAGAVAFYFVKIKKG